MKYLIFIFILVPTFGYTQQVQIGHMDTVEKSFLYEYACNGLYFNDSDYYLRESQHVEFDSITNFPNYSKGLYVFLQDANTIMGKDRNYTNQQLSRKITSILYSKGVIKDILTKYISDLRKLYLNDTTLPRGRWYPYIKSNIKMCRMYLGYHEVIVPNIAMISNAKYLKVKVPCYVIVGIFRANWER